MSFSAPLHGFAFWFDVEFNGPVRQKVKKQASQPLDVNMQNSSPSNKKKKEDVSIVLSTAPEDAPTHWQQVIALNSTTLVSFSLRYMASLKYLEICIANIHIDAISCNADSLVLI